MISVMMSVDHVTNGDLKSTLQKGLDLVGLFRIWQRIDENGAVRRHDSTGRDASIKLTGKDVNILCHTLTLHTI